ncbi:7-keto-8-aminopelargonate synthetase-like enzyme [Algoriphagus iocasae]|uniref:7-keto-8-aminopelargonate synthetase-like enzyme n=1 Tax=Algoriphagus iocasae TaxID=1836499 RepID=A0A841MEC4_9BACT|nr:aminotransferase class I/II-fold pyridoxal phosphate-dependent enzyme [Algoriphagus iocasae]MBB6326442.1 7-keto-8-aminopelargonate synthetase-like enzyme [Algoriphagus iocasae]
MKVFNLNTRIDRQIIHQGKTYHYFSGTSYLGIDLVPEFQEQVVIGMEQYGLNHGLSRINSVRLQIFDQFENYFAKETEAEAALSMSSGYLAGIAALQYLSKGTDQIWVAPDTHPAILPIELKPDATQEFEDWKNECLEKSSNAEPQKILVLGNAVNPMLPEIHDYSWLVQIAEKHEVSLLIDDSHAFGILGKGIFGTFSQWKNLPLKLVVTGSLGKGLGLPAGIILGDQNTCKAIKNLPIYGGASPCPPAYLYAFLNAKIVYEERRVRLIQLIKYFSKKNKIPEHIKGEENYPVFSYRPESWVEKFEANKIITSSFPYPTSKDPSVNRIIISAFHNAEDIDSIWSYINKIYKSK